MQEQTSPEVQYDDPQVAEFEKQRAGELDATFHHWKALETKVACTCTHTITLELEGIVCRVSTNMNVHMNDPFKITFRV